jgi:hypothetical protein
MARRSVALFRREDYETVRGLLPDLQLPASFDEWQQSQEENIAKMEARGDTVVKVVFDPKDFAVWCHRSGLDHNFASFGGFTVATARKQTEGGT